jgi:tripartite-type tricarboxylate transporter receptor subunit TctC
MNPKSLVFGSLCLLFGSAAWAPVAAAAQWPERPVRAIVPWAPGGSTDVVGRLVAADLTTRLKQQVFIENRAGAGSIVGLQFTAQAPPDGYTVLITSTAYGFVIDKPNPPVDLVESFMPVASLGFSDGAFAVTPQLPVKSVKELIALARAKPGMLTYASSGIGGFPHLNTELLKIITGVDILHVPYQGGGPAAYSVMAGNTQVYFGSLPTIMSQINSGRLKLLATGGLQRNPDFPNVPTVSETVPGYETYIWFGMFAPRGTPPAIIERLHDAVAEGLASPDLVKKLALQGAVPKQMSSAEFGKLMMSETTKWTEVIKKAKIRGE